jgi:hypothetical protein
MAVVAGNWNGTPERCGDGPSRSRPSTKDLVVLPHKDCLLLMSRSLQQLVMESFGKEKDLAGNVVRQGLAVW